MTAIFRTIIFINLLSTVGICSAFAASSIEQVEIWTGSYSANYNSDLAAAFPGMPSENESQTISAQVVLDKRIIVSEDIITWEGTATCNIFHKFHSTVEIPGTPMRTDVDGSDSRMIETAAELQLHLDTGKYFIGLCGKSYEYKTHVTGVVPSETGSFKSVSETGTREVVPLSPKGTIEMNPVGPIPEQGTHLMGSYDLPDGPKEHDPHENTLKELMIAGLATANLKVSGKVQWSISPVEQKPPEAWIEYSDGGEEWLPEHDNTVKAKLSWEENVTPTNIRFTLYEISAEPGISLNSKDENTDFDLEFDPKNNFQGYKISQSGKSFEATKDYATGQIEEILLHAKDFGAHGRLKAEIKVGEAWVVANSKPFDLPYLPIPYDENINFIADKWEKDVGIYNLNLGPEWDEDPYPGNQKNNGDGFTLYEEYRGFQEIGHVFQKGDNEQVKNGHVRMDPMYKDVFIYDENHLFFEFYRPYNPSALNWHLISPAMMKQKGSLESNADYRWVNFNTSKTYFLRNQYALVLKDGGQTKQIAGEISGLSSCGGILDEKSRSQPLKCNYQVVVFRQFIRNFVRKNPFPQVKGDALQALLTTTVIHEMGHAMGIIHHTHASLPEHCNNVTKNERGGTSCDPNTYGVQRCAMRYESGTEYKRADVIPMLKTGYCRDGEIYISFEADDAGNFKKFNSHNCYGQINIKGD